MSRSQFDSRLSLQTIVTITINCLSHYHYKLFVVIVTNHQLWIMSAMLTPYIYGNKKILCITTVQSDISFPPGHNFDCMVQS